MRVCMYVCIHVWMYVRMHLCMYVCMYVCMCMCMCRYPHQHTVARPRKGVRRGAIVAVALEWYLKAFEIM